MRQGLELQGRGKREWSEGEGADNCCGPAVAGQSARFEHLEVTDG